MKLVVCGWWFVVSKIPFKIEGVASLRDGVVELERQL